MSWSQVYTLGACVLLAGGDDLTLAGFMMALIAVGVWVWEQR